MRVVAAAALAGLVGLSGCEYHGISDLSLPGGATFGQPTYQVSAVFDDVLNLVPQSSVKVNDVSVGAVTSVDLVRRDGGYRALVRMKVKKSVVVPANAVATVRQTSLLGEKFVALGPPAGQPARGQVEPGTVIPNARTDRNPEVEEIFSALAALLNGGGVEQLQTISVELSNALTGRESQVRDLLDQLNTFVGSLDDRKSEIVRALDGLDRLSAILARQKQTIATAIDDIEPGLAVLADERSQLTALFVSLSKLGDIGSKVIRASREDTEADLAALQPVLANLEGAGRNIVRSLPLLLTYPFPRNSINGIPGDYGGLEATLDIDLAVLLQNLTGPPAQGKATPATPGAGSATAAPSPGPGVPILKAPTGGAGDGGGLAGLTKLLLGGLL